MKIVISTDYLYPDDEAAEELSAGQKGTPAAAVAQELAEYELSYGKDFTGADAVIIGSHVFGTEDMDAAPNLQVIARSGVGYDGVDLAAATERGIVVTNAPGTNHHSVAELTLGLLLACARNIAVNDAAIRQGHWPRTAGRELRGAVLGIIGYGAAGTAVARLGQALGMEIIIHSGHGDDEFPNVTLEELAQQADYVTIHTAASGTPVIDRDLLKLMKSTAIIINTARGSVIDEKALIDALKNGEIAGAGLDVFADEPLRDSPLLSMDNVVLAPHMGGQTKQARLRAGLVAAANVKAVLEGRSAQNPVNL